MEMEIEMVENNHDIIINNGPSRRPVFTGVQNDSPMLNLRVHGP